ncbi:putative effector [Erysiphe necator]|uniref:Putative effector n=1 Tax=Uncinula necator TaxID=52586 RepID=A0A0B1P757_UNCNE|nr:putative effector [Erysiphe necator]
MSKCFNTKNLGEMEMFLGMRITRDRKNRTLWLDQQQYLERTLTKFGIPNAKHRPVSIPLDGYENLTPPSGDEERIDPREFSMIIGSLMFAMVYTRPDIAFALGRLSQYMKEPTKKHGYALKKLMRYLRYTVDYRLRFSPKETVTLVVYSDADWATDKVDRKSISGGLGMLCGAAIFWLSRKQRSVSTSTAEAEYASASIVAKLGQWMAQVLRDMGYPEYVAPNGITVETRGDNQGALALIKNPHLNDRSKHIDICYHHIRDLHEKHRIRTEYVPTKDMLADGLTKPLGKGPFSNFVKMIGVGRD